ncbi:MAG: hypothetical protein HOD97_03440 [Candidatus Marinimicrobia bacterium]|jgi:hypothetical protein|nr:hypothetical protein [Candidatus Neomarinimicrobiota bacterium]MBT3618327.1 hypothetical protein [Candidatus Neomarinimicrobiota bacterium]MBT3828272.1 hypothetical protein [Candidatus Neomarinimicrobiota bacterium]MBT3997189.1 hypothetical protein [Candidatus Neomarinimicrobiota bacterium]MBT4280655.1 hypothetical protein [Candidatus Neomarinimicrobiota bacterium]
MNGSNFEALFHVLNSEQQILMRTDQKAFTLMSILGVFMVFFIIHFLKIQINWVTVTLVLIYFIAALISIINLVLVIVPRIRNDRPLDDSPEVNATFFGGISQFNSSQEYATYLKEVAEDDEKMYNMFSNQVFALGKINKYKNSALKKAIMYFAIAIISELLIIMYMAWSRALPFLFSG